MNTLSDQMVLWVVNVLIHSTVLTAVLLCVALLFRKRAAMRYWILCCGLLLVLASPAVSALVQSNGSGWLTLALPNETVPTTVLAATEQPTPANDSPMQGLPTQQVNAFITPPVPDFNRTEEVANTPIVSKPTMAADVPANYSATTPAVKDSRSPMQWLAIIVTAFTVVWALGATLLLMRMTIGWIRLAGILRRADSITDPDYVAVFTKACALAGCKEVRTPRLLVSDEVTGPLAAGVLTGSVVLPKRLINESSPVELAEVLVHEVAHVVRRDQIVVLLQNLVAAIYWPHPLVGKLNRELAKAREEVCDNFVLATTDAPIYSRTLLSLAQLVQQPETVPGSVGFFASRWKLEQRVAGLLDESRDTQTLLSKRGWAFVLISAVGLLSAIYVGTVTIATAQVNDELTVEEPVNPRTVQVRGQVLKPDGSPASGATVRSAAPVYGDMRGLLGERFETAMTEVVADEKGQFEISIDTQPYGDMPVLGTKWEDHWKYTVVSATMPGFAGQFAKFKDVEESDAITLQLVEDTPIRGRIIGLEGQPISGVSVNIEDIWVPRADNLDAWLSAVENGEPAWTAVKHLSRQCKPRMLGVPETVTSDENGDFEINGVGRERRMEMHAHGNGIAFDSFKVVSRSIDPLPWDETGGTDSPTTVYGARFTLTGRPSRTVTGTVTDAETGLPLAGVDVAVSMMPGTNIAKLWLLPTKTNEQGSFRIEGMPKGNGNQLMVRPTDDQPYFMREIDVPDPDGMDPIAIDIQLHRGIWIEGTVVDKRSREPVAGARVHYLPLLTNKFADELPEFDRGNVDGQQDRYQTDADGKYRLVGLPGPAVIGVESIHQSFQSGVGYKELTVPKDEKYKRPQTYSNPIMPGPKWPDSMRQIEPDEATKKVQLDLELIPGPEISVSVFDESGQWLSGATLVSANQRIKLQNTPVDVVNLSPDESRVIVVHQKERSLGIVHHVTAAAIADGQLPLTARKCATITGRLVDDGKPLPGIRVRPNILPSGDFGSALPTVTTDTRGVFRTELLPGCKYKLSLEGEPFKYATFEENIEVSTGERIDLGTISPTTGRKFKRTDGSNEFTSALDRMMLDSDTPQVFGRVFDTDGNPIAGAKIYRGGMPGKATDDEQQAMPVAMSDDNGDFDFTISALKRVGLHGEQLLRFGTVVAMQDGFAPAVTNIHDRKPGDPLQMRLVANDAPISGRILDLQGQPIPGVKVSFNSLQVPKPNSLGVNVWRRMLDDRPDGMAVQGKFFSRAMLPSSISERQVETDTDGRFEMPSFGSGRIVALLIESPTIQTQEIRVVTGVSIEPISVPWYEDAPKLGTLHYVANNFDFVAGPTRPITGVVKDLDTGEPLSGFSVSGGTVGNPMRPIETTSDRQGRFHLTGVSIGSEQTLSVLPPKDQPFIAVQRRVNITPSEDPLEIDLTAPRGVWVEGKVVDLRTDRSAGANLSYFVFEKNQAYKRLGKNGLRLRTDMSSSSTNDDGTFRLAVLPGSGVIAARGFRDAYMMGVGYELIVEGRQSDGDGFLKTAPHFCYTKNYHTVVQVNPAVVDDKLTISIGLDPGLAAEGHVVDPQGKPVAGASIRGTRAMAYWRETESSDFKAFGFTEGKSRQLLFCHRERNLAGQAVIAPGTTDATVQLQPAATVSGRLLDRNGAPISHVPIVSYTHGGNKASEVEHDFLSVPSSLDIRTDDQGKFQMTSLVPGLKYAFGIEDEPGRFPTLIIKSIALEPGETRDIGDIKPLTGPHAAP